MPEKEILNVRARFDEYMRRNRKRRTPERFAIFDAVAHINGHFTAEHLGNILSDKGFRVSVATVYSTLRLLKDFGMVTMHAVGNQAAVFEKVANGQQACHNHLICTGCGKIKDSRDPALGPVIENSKFAGFSQTYYTLYIYGLCGACSRRKKKSTKKK